jgi:hypothetical protein
MVESKRNEVEKREEEPRVKHLRPVSGMPRPAQTGGTSILEQIILLLLTTFFSGWDNFDSVINNLEKYYRKTPD